MNITSENYRAVTGARPRKSRAKDADSTAVAGRPTAPRWLSKDALGEWRRIVPLLARRGTLTRVDSMTIALYCSAVARYVLAQRSLEAEGLTLKVSVLDSHGTAHVSTKPNPSLKVLESCERTIHRFSREFGGTPRSRELTKPAQPGTSDRKESSDAKLQREADAILKRLKKNER